jgi:hypothetical protein
MQEFVNTNFLLATSLARQYDITQQEFISARYAFEMVSRAPGQRGKADEVEARRIALQTAEFKMLATEQVIKDLTELDIPTLRNIVDEFNTLLERLIEVDGELRNRKILSPILQAVLEPETDETSVQSKKDLAERIQETPLIESHRNLLVAALETLAQKVKFNPVNNTTAPLITLG